MEPASSSSFITASDLTPRQADVAALIAQGLSYKRTAHELGISRFTVGEHVQAIAAKIPGNESPRVRIMLRCQVEVSA